jgi:hypothetical protein
MIISGDVYPYLRAQHGMSDAPSKREEFEKAYVESIQSQYDTFAHALPKTCRLMYDIGGGMSGIGLLIRKRYTGKVFQNIIVDGFDEPPVVNLHRKPFSSYCVARGFYADNGAAGSFGYLPHDSTSLFEGVQADLILSISSWCFHYAPGIYIPRVAPLLQNGTVVILDVRRDRDDWMDALDTEFGDHFVVHTTPKRIRCVWRIV